MLEESIGLIQPTPKAFAIVSPGLRAQRSALPWVWNQKLSPTLKGLPSRRRNCLVCELFQSSLIHNRLDPQGVALG